MGDQIITREERVTTLRELLDNAKDQLAIALPGHLDVDKLLRMSMTVLQQNTDLLECTAESVVGAIMQCAQLGLYPDNTVLGHAYLVPFNTKVKLPDGSFRWRKRCQLIPGYRGLIDLCHRSGAIQWVDAFPVYEGDQFRYQYGLNPVLDHVPADPEPITETDPMTNVEIVTGYNPRVLQYVYALGKLKNGDLRFRVMHVSEVDAIRLRSRAADKGPWVTDRVPMSQKTVLRQWVKYVPMSPEVSIAVTLDELHERAIDQRLSAIGAGLIPLAERQEPDVPPGDPLEDLVGMFEKEDEGEEQEGDEDGFQEALTEVVTEEGVGSTVDAKTVDVKVDTKEAKVDTVDDDQPDKDPLVQEYNAVIKTIFDIHGDDADKKCASIRRTCKVPLDKEFTEFNKTQKTKYLKALKGWIAYEAT